MKEPEDLRELLGEDLSAEELARLERIDALLRSVPAPPAEVPAQLTRSLDRIGAREPRRPRRRLAFAVGFAAAVAAAAFGLGRWTTSDDFDARAVVPMQATEAAPQAAGVIQMGRGDQATGNWDLKLDVSGLPSLPRGDYYVLWLAKDGEYAATCGTFNVGDGTTRVEMTVSYRLSEYDAWAISRHGDQTPVLLQAKI